MGSARALITASALLAASTVAACGSSGSGTASTPSSVTTLAVTRVEPSGGTTDGTPTATAGDKTVTMAFAGDVHFVEEIAPYLDDPAGLAPVARMLSAADLAVVNLETAITTRGAPEPKKYHFRAPATALDALRQAGVDLVSMANNHAVDFGVSGLADTLAAKAGSQIPVIGIGRDADEAFAPYTSTIKGRTVAVLAATQVPDWTAATWAAGPSTPGVASAREPRRLIDAVENANESADIVVVFLHWGTERVGCPTAEQRTLAQALARAGADIIVGAHAHVLLGAGWLDRTFVDYGLGNFMWYGANSQREATTGVLTLSVSDGAVSRVSWLPARIPPGGGLPQVVTGSAARTAVRDWKALRSCTGLSGRRSE
jgi:poly-gamma-glutamate capsule biosynthesis protein CapA/YwtB (metallophosphatase superfamily)